MSTLLSENGFNRSFLHRLGLWYKNGGPGVPEGTKESRRRIVGDSLTNRRKEKVVLEGREVGVRVRVDLDRRDRKQGKEKGGFLFGGRVPITFQ